jgi:quercetin dioxygenase-like cupin family protein
VLAAPISTVATFAPTDSATDVQAEEFGREGFVGPFRAFGSGECREIAAYLRRADHPPPPDWAKSRAVRERFLYELATHPKILPRITPLLGGDVVLWGASKVVRGPGVTHPWHSDIESAHPEGRFATVWIGIEHTTRESALQVISRSHRLGKTVQEYRSARGLRRELATPAAMLVAVQEHEPDAALIQPDMSDGDALIFDGRLWHGSHNSRARGHRVALLLQYAAAACEVRIPDLTQLDWPFRHLSEPRPRVIVVAGTDRSDTNRVVPPPPPLEGLPMVTTAIHEFAFPFDPPTPGWHMFPAFRGPTATLSEMSCHASVLTAGHTPHPPHAHVEEELLIPLDGELELRIAGGPADPAPSSQRLSPGQFIYYPAGQHHTLLNPQSAPVAYLMFKWRASFEQLSAERALLPTTVCRYDDAPSASSAPFCTQRVFEGGTTYLDRLHAHLTLLRPDAGYAPHVDAYDVAIVTLAGTVETLGRRVEPGSVIYYAAGERHGMRNVGTTTARYLVFEFHTTHVGAGGPRPHRFGELPGRALRFGKRLARPIWRRLRRD